MRRLRGKYGVWGLAAVLGVAGAMIGLAWVAGAPRAGEPVEIPVDPAPLASAASGHPA